MLGDPGCAPHSVRAFRGGVEREREPLPLGSAMEEPPTLRSPFWEVRGAEPSLSRPMVSHGMEGKWRFIKSQDSLSGR